MVLAKKHQQLSNFYYFQISQLSRKLFSFVESQWLKFQKYGHIGTRIINFFYSSALRRSTWLVLAQKHQQLSNFYYFQISQLSGKLFSFVESQWIKIINIRHIGARIIFFLIALQCIEEVSLLNRGVWVDGLFCYWKKVESHVGIELYIYMTLTAVLAVLC